MVKVDQIKIQNTKKRVRPSASVKEDVPETKSIKEELVDLDDEYEAKMTIKNESDVKPRILPTVVALGTLQFNKVECGKQIEFEALKHKKKKGISRDPFKALAKLKETKEKLSRLEEQGKLSVAEEIVHKRAWKAALLKAEGLKVKDDIKLVERSVKRKIEKKQRSSKKWDLRVKSHEQAKANKQKKRTENIKKRRDTKKDHKMKRLVKKGRYVPGGY